MLALTALLLARETKGLLIGEPASPRIVDSITRLAAELTGVTHANQVFTVHLGPEQIMVVLSVEFDQGLLTHDIEARVIELEQRVRGCHPAVVAVFIKPQTCHRYQETDARVLNQVIE